MFLPPAGCIGRLHKSVPSSVPTAYHQRMHFFEALATAFFRTFGITQPTESALRRAAWFLFGLLALILLSIVAVVSIVLHIM